jgi:hypothetical protein
MTLILSGTDGVSDVDGSAATPAVRGADANTGIFFPAADTIAFAEGGTEVARITNTAAWSFGASGTATGTSGQVLTSAGSSAAPAWANPATVNLTTGVTGTLPVANGGTGQTALSAVAVGTSTNLAGGSNGTIPYQSAAGTTQMLAVGTAGQVLQTNGAGAPTWVTPGGGSLIFLQEVVASSSATVDLTAFSSTYDDYVVIFSGVTLSDIDWLTARLSVGGVFRTGSSYARALHFRRSDDPNYRQEQSVSSNSIYVTTQAKAELYWPTEGVIKILGVNNTNTTKGILIESRYYNHPNNTQASATGHGIWGSDFGAVTGIRFLPQSVSNIAVGTFRLYGIKKS